MTFKIAIVLPFSQNFFYGINIVVQTNTQKNLTRLNRGDTSCLRLIQIQSFQLKKPEYSYAGKMVQSTAWLRLPPPTEKHLKIPAAPQKVAIVPDHTTQVMKSASAPPISCARA